VKEWLEAFGNAPVFVLDKAAFEFTGIMVEKRPNWFEARGPTQLPDHIRQDLDSIL
ncbi:hypothetical protein HZC07_03420, partial [Candidatus Micrarchaeota archaeon]|nr:hypothetical protein [Candidatus Micrarchaeota archaeon]